MAVAEVVGVVAAVELVPVEDRLQPPQGTVLRAADRQRVPGNLWVRFNNFKLIPQEICVVFFYRYHVISNWTQCHSIKI